MASNQTEHYGLNQWERSDKVLMEEFNEDNAKLDAALAAQAGAMEDKADVTALEALARTVSTLSGTVSGQSSTLSGKGNCQICTTSYTGNDQYGASGANRLTFPGRPLALFISGGRQSDILVLTCNGRGISLGSSPGMVTTSWGANYVSWYSEQNAEIQHNGKYTYQVVALLAMD